MTKNKNFVALALVTSLFFIWGFALNLNPILITHLKKACQLSYFQSSFVDSASCFGFFLFALFILFSGSAFLETAANPYITCLGDPETATHRINFSQSFNGLA